MSKKILIIDDEELVSKSLVKLLKKEGFDAVLATSGSAALKEVAKIDFDLIISDVRMPGMDGIETIKQIRMLLEKENKKAIPEVLITGYADMEKYESASELEIVDYLYKPFDNEEFLRVVRKNI